jgi:alpha-glucoside transport system substrate-binding protein
MKTALYAGAATMALTLGATAQDMPFEIGEGDFNWDSLSAFAEKYDLSGQSLSITGPWTGEDKELVDSVIAYFEDATGAAVEYSGSDSFESDFVIAAQAGSAPDMAVFPQPGLMADMARAGNLVPMPEGTADWLRENYAAGESWVDLGSVDDELYGFFYKVDVKSLVWYVPEAFEEAGYEVPETLEDLKALSEQIVEDGGTPWCIGLGSGAATGWPATDWVEDMMLRTQTPEDYDAWVNNELAFDDPKVIEAIEEFGAFARNEDWVDGGSAAVASTDFRESPLGLFQFPPECYMHKQASFIPTFFPEGTEVGLDVDFFYFPAYEGRDLGSPVLGAGTAFGRSVDNEATTAFVEFLKLPIAHEMWMAQGGFLTAHAGVNTEAYSEDSLRAQGQILLDATTFRFDASDLMPGEIGAGAFWTGMVDYVTGEDAESVAASIQERWNALN